MTFLVALWGRWAPSVAPPPFSVYFYWTIQSVTETACLPVEYEAGQIAGARFLEHFSVTQDVGMRIGCVLSCALKASNAGARPVALVVNV